MTNKLTTDALDAAERLNPDFNAFLSIEREYAESKTAQAPSDSPVSGLPVAIKDNICTTGLRTSCGSKILEGYSAHYSATAVSRLEEAGAIIVGKTNMDEFAMGSSNENSAYSIVRNPWNLDCVPGGSSGGSAAAVAAGIVDAALGSETGGSVRQPAAFCGVVGLKPTYGRVSRYGLVAFASSLDQIGFFGRSTKNIADVLEVCSGRDESDATSADVQVEAFSKTYSEDPGDVTIGIPRALFGAGLDEEVRDSIEAAIDAYRQAGYKIVDIELPHSDYSIAVYYILATAEASSNLARFDGVRYGFRASEAEKLREMYMKTRDQGFGEEVKRRIMLGTYVLSSGYYDAYYSKAQKVRTLLKQDFENAFKLCDVVLTPTSPSTAFKIGERTDDPLAMYLSDIYTASANLAGIPGISVPSGLSQDGMPIGMQLLGNHWSEELLLRMSHKFEQLRPFDHKPKFHASTV